MPLHEAHVCVWGVVAQTRHMGGWGARGAQGGLAQGVCGLLHWKIAIPHAARTCGKAESLRGIWGNMQ